MSPRRPNATLNIKAKTRPNAADADVATRMGREENAQRPTFNVQHRSQTKTSVDTIVRAMSAFAAENTSPEEIGGPKIDIAGLLTASPARTGRYRRLW